MNDFAPAGHNGPPLWDRDALVPLATRAQELLDAEARLPAIEDDATAGKAADFVKLIGANVKKAEDQRKAAKEPLLAAGKELDGAYKAVTDPLAALKARVEAKVGAYLRDKEAKARAVREAAERAAREEAERRAAAMQTEQDLAQAEAAEETAQAAAQAAAVKPAELARTRSEYGAVGTLRTEWTFEVTDAKALDLEALRSYLPADAIEKAMRAAIRAGVREIKGARIFETSKAVIR